MRVYTIEQRVVTVYACEVKAASRKEALAQATIGRRAIRPELGLLDGESSVIRVRSAYTEPRRRQKQAGSST